MSTTCTYNVGDNGGRKETRSSMPLSSPARAMSTKDEAAEEDAQVEPGDLHRYHDVDVFGREEDHQVLFPPGSGAMRA